MTVLSSTAVHVTWSQPALANGVLLGYELHETVRGQERVVFSGNNFSYHIHGLSPFTLYEYRVSAKTNAGPGYSEWTRVTTKEDSKFQRRKPLFGQCLTAPN